jgi:hypothetical protein
MKALTLQRTSAAKAGWIIGLIFFAWLAFLFVPVPRSRTKEVTPVVPLPPSKLRVAGLKDNPDWDGLPELFAIWSDSADWQGDKTQFAYWHPTDRTYSYYFEAARKDGKVRFRPLTRSEAFASRVFRDDGSYFETDAAPGAVPVTVPDFGIESPTHPFVFFRHVTFQQNRDGTFAPKPVSNPAVVPAPLKIEPVTLPKMDSKDALVPNEPKRK